MARMPIMNGLTNADQMDLSQYPLESLHFNYTAQADFLTDLKSVTLHMLVEQLGLADPERFVWALRARVAGNPCPTANDYLIVQRNYDYLPSGPNLIQYSSYVNDILYSYIINENCTGTPIAFTIPFSTDPEAVPYSAVAANNYDGYGLAYLNNSLLQPVTTGGGLQVGSFYTGLTRDDVAGLKYLFTTNNVNYETPDPLSLLFTVTTNYTTPQLFPNGDGTNGTTAGAFYFYNGTYGYGDYGWLVATSKTNSPAQLQALYPGLLIASSTYSFAPVTNAIVTQYFTNLGYGQPYPPPVVLVTVTNYTVNWMFTYQTTFANVITNRVSPNTVAYLQTITVSPNLKAPAGSPPLTNVTTQTIVYSNQPSGDFFLVPLFHTNQCPLDFLSAGLPYVLPLTNFLTGASTNVVTTTNTSAYSSTMSQVNYFTNYSWVIRPVTCAEVANAVNHYQGIGGTKFVRADYDSLIGQFFDPVTNYYSVYALTNSQWQLQSFVRVATRPDISMVASDQAGANTYDGTVFRSLGFTPSPTLGGLAGPGTITSPSTFNYNKVGDAFWNGYLFQIIGYDDLTQFLGQYGAIPGVAWASFDASTNAPELYPNGASIQNLENQIAVKLSPTTPPDGTNGTPYSIQFTASGGAFSPPFTWSAAGIPGVPGSGLPPGLLLAADGTLSGTPTSSGIFDFILQLSDSLGRGVQWTFSITIH